MKEVSKHYLSKKGKDYFHGRFGPISEFGRIFQSTYFRPYCDSTMDILDFGCGDGTILSVLSARTRFGIEVNPVCHEAIQKKNIELIPPIQVNDAIGQIHDTSVDLVISNHCLEHVLNPVGTAKEMWRVLRPGGRLVIVTPFDDWRSGKNQKWRAGDKDNHLFTWSPLNLGNLLTEAGFEIHETRLCSLAWSPKIFWIGKRFGMKPFRAACRLLAVLKNRREVFCIGRKPDPIHDSGNISDMSENVEAQ